MKFAITHLTTACVLLEVGSVRILTDPIFDTGRVRYRLSTGAYATRSIGPSIAPEKLLPIDAVLLSHSHHADNLDPSGRSFIKRCSTIITCAADKKDIPGSQGLAP